MWKSSSLHVIHHDKHPLIMAHRGDSSNVPENTLPAFEDAYQLGVDCIETDCHMTKDGEFIFLHDARLNRTTEGKGKVEEYTLEQVQTFDAGYKFQSQNENHHKISGFPFRGKGLKIQKIDDIIPRFPNVRFNIDIKSKKVDAPILLAKKLKEIGVEKRVVVGSFWQNQINEFRKYSSIITSAGPKEALKFWRTSKKWLKNHAITNCNQDNTTPELVFGSKLPYYILQIPESLSLIRIITPEFIRFAHFLGIAIQVWTINERRDMERLLKWGVDGIFSDRPKLLKEVIGELFL